MKTIQELNSKWYWRLIKVIYGALMLIIIALGSIGFLTEYTGYHPDNIKMVQDELNQFKKMYNEMRDFNNTIENEFPNHYISKEESLTKSGIIFSGTTMKVKQLGIIKGFGYNIEGVVIGTQDDPELVFDDWQNIKGFEIYVKDRSSLQTIIANGEEFISSSQDTIESAKNGEYIYFGSSKINYNFDEKIGDKNYIGILLIIKTIGVCILMIFSLVGTTILIRGILYYIILGKFNPEK